MSVYGVIYKGSIKFEDLHAHRSACRTCIGSIWCCTHAPYNRVMWRAGISRIVHVCGNGVPCGLEVDQLRSGGTCQRCGASFDLRAGNQVYCSFKCRVLSNNRRYRRRHGVEARGVKVKRRNAERRAAERAERSPGRHSTAYCARCDAEFERSRSNQLYCSKKCNVLEAKLRFRRRHGVEPRGVKIRRRNDELLAVEAERLKAAGPTV